MILLSVVMGWAFSFLFVANRDDHALLSVKLLSTSFMVILEKTSNHDVIINKYSILIGVFQNMSTKLILKRLMTIRPGKRSIIIYLLWILLYKLIYTCILNHTIVTQTINNALVTDYHSEYVLFYISKLLVYYNRFELKVIFLIKKKNVFNSSDLLFIGSKCHMLLIFSNFE